MIHRAAQADLSQRSTLNATRPAGIASPVRGGREAISTHVIPCAVVTKRILAIVRDQEKPMSNTKATNTICLWFNKDAQDAARFYAATFPNSEVTAIHIQEQHLTNAGCDSIGAAYFRCRSIVNTAVPSG